MEFFYIFKNLLFNLIDVVFMLQHAQIPIFLLGILTKLTNTITIGHIQ